LSTQCATALTVFGHQAHQLPAQPAENLAAQVIGQPVFTSNDTARSYQCPAFAVALSA
jgi:hypothetical protein